MSGKKRPYRRFANALVVANEEPVPRFLLGVAELAAGARRAGCGQALETVREVRAFENLEPLCDLCSLEHGPPWLVRLCPPAVEAVSEHVGVLHLERLLEAGERWPEGETEESVLEVLDAAMELGPAESRRAAGIVEEFAGLGLEEATARMRGIEPRFKTPALYHQLAEKSWRRLREVPQRARELAELAVVALERLDDGLLGREAFADLEADAWARLGNARRVACDLHAADEALEEALLAYERGSLLPMRKAEILDFLGSLRRDQQRFDEALVCLERALDLYRLYRDHERVAKVLNAQATVFMEIAKPERAVAIVRQAIGLIDGEREPHLLLACYHNLVIYLCESARHAEAARLLPLVEEYQRAVGGPTDYTRFIWIRGKVAFGLKQFSKAEAFFLSAQHRFTELGDACNAAAAVLDLASCYLEEGRENALLYLAADALPIFQSRKIPREAMAALELFRRGLESNAVTQELIAEIRAFLRQSQRNPELCYVPAGSKTRKGASSD